MVFTQHAIAKMIDHAVLHPTATDQDLTVGAELAKEYNVATLCVKPYHTPRAKELLQGSGVGVCGVIGFPHGGNTSYNKEAEIVQMLAYEVSDIDMVVNIGKVLSGDWDYVEYEIGMLGALCSTNNVVSKVIFETDYISKHEDIIRLCQICNTSKVNYVKTSTGFGFVKQMNGEFNSAGATLESVKLMRKYTDESIGIKASGGIKTLADVLQFVDAGATRIGTSSTKQILDEIKKAT